MSKFERLTEIFAKKIVQKQRNRQLDMPIKTMASSRKWKWNCPEKCDEQTQIYENMARVRFSDGHVQENMETVV